MLRKQNLLCFRKRKIFKSIITLHKSKNFHGNFKLWTHLNAKSLRTDFVQRLLINVFGVYLLSRM